MGVHLNAVLRVTTGRYAHCLRLLADQWLLGISVRLRHSLDYVCKNSLSVNSTANSSLASVEPHHLTVFVR